MTQARINSYAEFWPFYVSQHLNQTCRRLHFVGTAIVIFFLLMGIISNPTLLWFCPFAGYGFAWVGHFMFEKNRPATFKYPLWSLIADFQMFGLTLLGKMGPEISRARNL